MYCRYATIGNTGNIMEKRTDTVEDVRPDRIGD